MMRTQNCITIFTAIALIMLMSSFVFAEDQGKININTATAEELVQLDRVGPSYADKIVAFRQENGLFKTPEDIMLVAGIGQKTFELNKDRIIVK
ncbi:MAG: helix-hairpin-helix domain-containing protein [Desulfobacterales bacterium]|nr:helix-hairpin-helix domain-containing protein [Desulfobacterales bacterium]MDX2511982.1 helix-hairpin-helix domain-containing protein [Desulfobacterales bacterium]